jgi:chemotaxis protein CheD
VSFDPGGRPDGGGPAASPGGDLWPGAARREYLAPGRLYASAEAVQVTTILGSCVAVCLWDPDCRVGGMNHFLLPEGAPASPRFGESAVPLLVARVLELGAARSGLRAKVFGGASVLEAFRDRSRHIGPRNVEVARAGLLAQAIPVVGEDVGGGLGRKVVFEVQTGCAWVRAIKPGA